MHRMMILFHKDFIDRNNYNSTFENYNFFSLFFFFLFFSFFLEYTWGAASKRLSPALPSPPVHLSLYFLCLLALSSFIFNSITARGIGSLH